jgi:uncharacterized protein YcbX
MGTAGDTMTVQTIWRYPVKSMGGEKLVEARVERSGLAGDRAYALVDEAEGRIASAKLPRKWGAMITAEARYVHPPIDDQIPVVRIRLPDGTHIMSDSPTIHDVLSKFVGRGVRITSTRPKAISVERLDPLAEGEVIADIGELMPEGRFADYAPLHLITTSTLRELRRLNPQADFDERRFRPNLVIDIAESRGFAEQDWIGKTLAIGDMQVRVSDPTPRCSVPTLAQSGLAKDRSIVSTLVEHSRLPVALLGGELLPCAGVYAFVAEGGTVRAGDPVRIS